MVSPVTNNVDSTICYGDSALLAGKLPDGKLERIGYDNGGASNTCDNVCSNSVNGKS